MLLKGDKIDNQKFSDILIQMSKLVAKKRPVWLQEIAAETERLKKQAEKDVADNVASPNIAELRMQLAIIKLQAVEAIEAINDKHKTDYILEDLFSITTEEEQQAIDVLETEEDGDED